VFLVEEDDPQGLVERLGPQLPPGFQVLGAAVVELRGPSLMSLAVGAEYTLRFLDLSPAEVAGRVEELLAAEQIVVARSRKVRRKRRRRRERVLVDVDVRPMIHSLQVVPGEPAVHLTLAAVDGVPGKAREVAALFTERAERVRVLVRDTLCLVDGELVSIGGG